MQKHESQTEADGYEGIIFQSEGAWSLHQREGRYRFDQGKLRDVETGELLGRFVCERSRRVSSRSRHGVRSEIEWNPILPRHDLFGTAIGLPPH